MPEVPDQKPFIHTGPILPISRREYEEGSFIQEKRLNFLEQLVQFNVVLNLIVGALILFIVILVVAWRLNLINYFGGKSAAVPSPPEQIKLTKERVVLAADADPPPIFISEQSMDIEKVFQVAPSGIHLTISGQLKKEVFGYLPYWVVPKIGEINTKLLTTISYFGLEVDKNGDILKQDADGQTLSPWTTFQSSSILHSFIKKAQADKIKVLVTFKCFNQSNIEQLVTNPQARINFINNTIYLMNSKSLDGIDLDFEYIGEPPKEVRDGFSILVMDLSRELKRQHPQALLTIATFVDAASNIRIHDVALLSNHVDALVIMGYDFHTPNSAQTGPVAPLEGYGNSLVGLLSSYLEKVPAEKIILAVPYFGYDWPVEEGGKNVKVVGSRADVRILSYAQTADAAASAQIQWDENGQTPWYSYKDPSDVTRVTHFENTRSLGIKYDYINEKRLKGVGIWALGFDGKREELLQLLADKFSQ